MLWLDQDLDLKQHDLIIWKKTTYPCRKPCSSRESRIIQDTVPAFIPTQLGIGEGGTANKTTTNGVGMFIPIIPMWWKAKRLGRMAKVTGLTGMIWPRDGWSTVWMAIDSQVLHMGRVSGPESQNLYFMLIFDKDSNPFKSINHNSKSPKRYTNGAAQWKVMCISGKGW